MYVYGSDEVTMRLQRNAPNRFADAMYAHKYWGALARSSPRAPDQCRRALFPTIAETPPTSADASRTISTNLLGSQPGNNHVAPHQRLSSSNQYYQNDR